MPCVGQQCVIVVFPGHAYLLFVIRQDIAELSKSVARTLKKLCTSKEDYLIKQ